MNPLIQNAVTAFIRHALTILGTWFVAQGIMTEEASAEFVGGAAIAIGALAWSFYEKYVSRRKLVTALASPKGTTEREVERHISSGEALPPVTLAKTHKPTTGE